MLGRGEEKRNTPVCGTAALGLWNMKYFCSALQNYTVKIFSPSFILRAIF